MLSSKPWAGEDATFGEVRAVWRIVGLFFGFGTIQRFFKRHNITRKKRVRMPRSKNRPDILKRRQDWFDGQLDLDPERLVFIDETWASTNMARRYGRCRIGERIADQRPSWSLENDNLHRRSDGGAASSPPLSSTGPSTAFRSRLTSRSAAARAAPR